MLIIVLIIVARDRGESVLDVSALDKKANPFLTIEGPKPPMDVEGRLAAMRHRGRGTLPSTSRSSQ